MLKHKAFAPFKQLLGLFVLFSAFVSLTSCSDNKLDDESCVELILGITHIPFKDSISVPGKYYEVLDAREDKSIRLCLLNNITNETLMPDPRQVPGRQTNNRIGDVSVYMLWRMYDLSHEDILPQRLWSRWDHMGVFVYHEYIREDGAREALQKRLIRKLNEVPSR